MKITKGMVLSAGFGKRLLPITDTLPKPLVSLNGKTLLDRALDHLRKAGVIEIIVNVHHLGHMIIEHLKKDSAITISQEDPILETGGGIRKVLDFFENKPFFALNGDMVWIDDTTPALELLSSNWDDTKMDVLLLLVPKEKIWGYEGKGDYFLYENGHIVRRTTEDSAPYINVGTHLLHPRIYEKRPVVPFSNLEIYDEAQSQGRLRGISYQGKWFHIGTPKALKECQSIFQDLET
jgi:MurNAc alpha-1-phosphate uridylyltransferase